MRTMNKMLKQYFSPGASILRSFGLPKEYLKCEIVDNRDEYWEYYKNGKDPNRIYKIIDGHKVYTFKKVEFYIKLPQTCSKYVDYDIFGYIMISEIYTRYSGSEGIVAMLYKKIINVNGYKIEDLYQVCILDTNKRLSNIIRKGDRIIRNKEDRFK